MVPVALLAGIASARWMAGGKAAKVPAAIPARALLRRKLRREVITFIRGRWGNAHRQRVLRCCHADMAEDCANVNGLHDDVVTYDGRRGPQGGVTSASSGRCCLGESSP